MAATGWEVEKDVLYPGRVVVPGPDGTPLAYTFTRRDADRIAATGNAKLRDGWAIPLCFEHQDVQPARALQLSQGERDYEHARGVFGHVAGFRVDPSGRVKAVLRGPDPADLKQFEKLRFVSPEVQWDWMDSDGRTWAGPTITHVAATGRPVQRHQTPVGVRLSLAAREIPCLEKFCGAVRVAPTIGASAPAGRPRTIRLSLTDYEAPMADELDFGAGGTGTGDAGKGSPWERIAAALAGAGVQIGDGKNVKDPEHLADLIEVACMNSDQGQEDVLDDLEPDDGAPEGDMPEPPPGATAAPMPPLQMSLRRQQEQAEGFARRNLASRIDALEETRRVTPAIAAALRAEGTTVRLSFAASGDVKANALTTKLGAYEALPANAAWSPTGPAKGRKAARLSQRGAAVPRSKYEAGEAGDAETPEQTQATLDAWRATGK